MSLIPGMSQYCVGVVFACMSDLVEAIVAGVDEPHEVIAPGSDGSLQMGFTVPRSLGARPENATGGI